MLIKNFNVTYTAEDGSTYIFNQVTRFVPNDPLVVNGIQGSRNNQWFEGESDKVTISVECWGEPSFWDVFVKSFADNRSRGRAEIGELEAVRLSDGLVFRYYNCFVDTNPMNLGIVNEKPTWTLNFKGDASKLI